VHWIKAAVAAFEPKDNAVILDGCRVVKYNRLIVAPGLKLDWDAVEGLVETLGRNGVTSNYRYDLAPYTWELVQGLKPGPGDLHPAADADQMCRRAAKGALSVRRPLAPRRACSTTSTSSSAMPAACCSASRTMCPALRLHEKYNASLNFFHNLVAIDGPAKRAWFAKPDADRQRRGRVRHDPCRARRRPRPTSSASRRWPMPPAGWMSIRQRCAQDLRQHLVARRCDERAQRQDRRRRAQAGADRRRQRVADIDGPGPVAHYDGYGSCPLTVERGKIVLAEFGYGGTLLPSFPKWLIDGTKPSRRPGCSRKDAAADLLEGHAARQGMDGEARNRRLS
jgi:sulfide:quinone oxidoreductase